MFFQNHFSYVSIVWQLFNILSFDCRVIHTHILWLKFSYFLFFQVCLKNRNSYQSHYNKRNNPTPFNKKENSNSKSFLRLKYMLCQFYSLHVFHHEFPSVNCNAQLSGTAYSNNTNGRPILKKTQTDWSAICKAIYAMPRCQTNNHLCHVLSF